MPAATEVATTLIHEALERGQSALSEHESKRLLACYGVPVIAEELAQDAQGALAVAERLGYPVAVKADSSSILHKSDQGLVVLNVDDADAVAEAVAHIAQAVPDTELQGYLVQQMARGNREVIVGGSRDKLFGSSVMLGLGGVLVEAYADVAFRLAPLDIRDAFEMINEIRAQRMFGAVRGEPRVDREALGSVLIAAGEVLVHHPEVSQVDINPLIFEGPEPVAVDALIMLDSSTLERGTAS